MQPIFDQTTVAHPSARATLPAWFANVRKSEFSESRLFCFPYAGGSSVIYHEWLSLLPKRIDVFPIQLPGRGTRLNAPPIKSLHQLVAEMLPEVKGYLDRPFFLFGHSMGALIAFEFARAVSTQLGVEPEVLFIGGRNAPSVPDSDAAIYQLSRQDFIERLKALNGTHPDLLRSEELLDLVLPALRADFEVVQTYSFREGARLNCPIKAFGGICDEQVTEAGLLAWKEFTAGTFSLERLPGDHFFIHSERRQLLASLSRDIEECLERRVRREQREVIEVTSAVSS